MKIPTCIIELIIILSVSFISVSAIVALLCLLCRVDFSVGKALVIWIIWFAMNAIRRKLNENNT